MILANPFQREVDEFHSVYMKSIDRVLRSGWYILGKEVEAFENEFAAVLGAKYGIGCASGLDALMLALKVIGVGPGDEVITTPLSAAATALAVTHLGAKPVFVDVLPETLSLDPSKIESAITARTKAVIPVHLYGYPAKTPEIEAICARHGISLIEDCAQAVGTKDTGGKIAGTRGRVGCFSFYPTKNLGAFGDAGFMCTDDPELAANLRKLRNYGQRVRYDHELAGYNSRLDELQAAVLREKLKPLETWTKRREEIARQYDETFPSIWKLPRAGDGRCVYHLYPIQVTDRDGLLRKLKAAEIEGSVHYPTLIPEQECYLDLMGGKKAEALWPVAASASRRLVSLPINPYVTDIEVKKITETLRASV
jgi:dTDP-4-amino-4,6-dideoxygalactose transaminase